MEKKKKGKRIFIVLLSVIILLAILFVVFWFFLKDKIFDKAGSPEGPGQIYFEETEKKHIKELEDIENVWYADNEILLTAKEGTSYKNIEKLAEKYEAEIVGWIEITGDYQLRVNKTYKLKQLERKCDEIAEEEIVENAYINYFTLSDTDADKIPKDLNVSGIYVGNEWSEDFWTVDNDGKSWNLEAVRCPMAWSLLQECKAQERAVKVGVIDGGFDGDHEDLKFSELFYNNNTDADDMIHGTHVAGTFAASADDTTGICGAYPYGKNNLYGVSTSGIKKYEENGYYMTSTLYNKIALAELILRDVKVINTSLNNSRERVRIISEKEENWEIEEEILQRESDVIGDFLDRLYKKGYDFLIVSSAGNINDQNYTRLEARYNSFLNYIDKNDYKDVYNRILVVGALDSSFEIASYSNEGIRTDIFAPGGDSKISIYSTVPGNKYQGLAGTSMATPLVSGIAADIWTMNNLLTGADVKRIICAADNYSDLTDAPMIDAYNCILEAWIEYYKDDNHNNEKKSDPQNGAVMSFTVDENTNAPLKNVTVTAVNVKTGKEYSDISDISGHFELILPEGTYTIKASAPEELGYDEYFWPGTEKSKAHEITIKNGNVNYLADGQGLESSEIGWIKMKTSYNWLVRPEIEADNIISYPYTSASFSGNFCSVLKKNNLYGCILDNGTVILDPIFERESKSIGNLDYRFSKHNPEFDSITSKLFETEGIEVQYYDNELIVNRGGAKGHPGEGLAYYYIESIGKVYVQADSIYSRELFEYNGNYSIPVRKGEIQGSYISYDYDSKYAIADKNGLKSEFEYDDAEICWRNECDGHTFKFDFKGCPDNCGIFACKKNGKWYYFNNTGKNLLDFGSDELDPVYEYPEMNNEFYHPSSGYLLVRSGNEYAYYDTDGNEVIPFGVFEKANPVHNGLAWVKSKKTGKWGVIRMDRNDHSDIVFPKVISGINITEGKRYESSAQAYASGYSHILELKTDGTAEIQTIYPKGDVITYTFTSYSFDGNIYYLSNGTKVEKYVGTHDSNTVIHKAILSASTGGIYFMADGASSSDKIEAFNILLDENKTVIYPAGQTPSEGTYHQNYQNFDGSTGSPAVTTPVTENVKPVTSPATSAVTETKAPETTKPEYITGTITTQSDPLRLRESPSLNGNIITQIPKGATVKIYDEVPEWYFVEYNGTFGYAYSEFITINN